MKQQAIEIEGEVELLPLPEFSVHMGHLLATDIWYLHNVGPKSFEVAAPYGFYIIEACPEGEPFKTSRPVRTGVSKVDLAVADCKDPNNWFRVPEPAENIAKDLARNFINWGVFASKNARPTSQELATAKGKLTQFFKRMLSEGDILYAKHGGPAIPMIEDASKMAVTYLGVDREWARDLSITDIKRDECPHCGAKTRLDVAFCPSGCVLDVNKALAAGRITKEMASQIREARGLDDQGRPKK